MKPQSDEERMLWLMWTQSSLTWNRSAKAWFVNDLEGAIRASHENPRQAVDFAFQSWRKSQADHS